MKFILAMLFLIQNTWAIPSTDLVATRVKALFINEPNAIQAHQDQFSEQGWQTWRQAFEASDDFKAMQAQNIQVNTNFLGIESMATEKNGWIIKARAVVNYSNDVYYQALFYTITLHLVSKDDDYVIDGYTLSQYAPSDSGQQKPKCSLKDLSQAT